MFISGGNVPLVTLAECSDGAVYVDGVPDRATARQLLDRVITVAELIGLREVHVWAEAQALPYLAVAAGGVKNLPEGFQLREASEQPADMVEGGLTWLSWNLSEDLAAMG